MTKEQAKRIAENWPVVLAWIEGAKVQVSNAREDNFTDFVYDQPAFDSSGYKWRINPEPKLRPWKPEEVPMRAVFRIKGLETWCLITGLNTLFVNTGWVGKNPSYQTLFQEWEHSTDDAETWLPCGILE